MLRSRSLWLSSLSQFGTDCGSGVTGAEITLYLDEVHHVPTLEHGLMAGLPVLVGTVGMFLGGWLTDWLTRHIGLRWGRGLPMAITRFSTWVPTW